MMLTLQELESKMITARSFNINSTTLKFNNDEYPLAQIKRSRVKTNTLKDHAVRLIIFGLIASSVVWIVTPQTDLRSTSRKDSTNRSLATGALVIELFLTV